MRKSLAVCVVMIVALAIDGSAQTRKRVRKPEPSRKPSAPSQPKQASAPEQDMMPSPFTYIPKPPPEGSPTWCQLDWQQAPEIAGVKLGMKKDYVLSMARHANKTSGNGLNADPFVTYYNISMSLLQNPLPDIKELEDLIDRNNSEALGEVRRKPKYVAPPKLRVRDEDTGTQVNEMDFGFEQEGYLFHIRARYFSTKTDWTWQDIKGMFESSGITSANWVRHTDVPINPLYRNGLEVMGTKIYKQTAYCKGFYLTVTYTNKPGSFTLDMINYPSLMRSVAAFNQWEKERKKNFKP